ncbi:MAG: phosphoenolpyruvate--protein phosphotransferase [Myxococcota bacterium]
MNPSTFRGLGVAPGLAIGPVHIVDRRRLKIPRYHVDGEGRSAEVSRFERAVASTARQLAELRERAADSQLSQVGLLLEAHEMILRDDALQGATKKRVEEDGLNAEWAVRNTLRDLKRLFDRLEQDFFRERRSDVDIVGDRLLRNLMGDRTDPLAGLPEGSVVVAYDLSPADTVELARQEVLAFVTETGGRTSHTAIMARALNVPCVLGVNGVLDHAGAGDTIIVDGRTGEVLLDPQEAVIRRYTSMQRRREEEVRALLADRDLPSETVDQVRVHLHGNVEVSQEIDIVLSRGGEGVGLYRTEFLPLERPDLRGHLEHFDAYRVMVERLDGRPFVIRTLDLGGDKSSLSERMPPNVPSSESGTFPTPIPLPGVAPPSNPALGLRAIRLSLQNRAAFREQLKGILLASALGPVRILLPLVTTLEEIREVRTELEIVQEDLTAEGRTFDEDIPLGMMIETPAAALLVDQFAKEVDFFAVGTNDLIQYLLAADRGNDEVAYLYRAAHPALIRTLAGIARVGLEHGKPVSICGEMAADPFFTPLLVGLGFRSLSMNPTSIPVVKRMVRRLEASACETFVSEALAFATSDEVERALAERLKAWTPDLFG